jgi:hypothetical protein
MSHSPYASRHLLIGRKRAARVTVNLIPLLLAPSVGISGYLLGGWPGVLTAEALWASVLLAGTLSHWLPHLEGRLRAGKREPQCDRNRWLDRFCVRLQQLQPSMSFPMAAQFALRTWPEAADLAPEKAAELYLAE